MLNRRIAQQIKQALEQTTLTKGIEPDAYGDAAQQFLDEYGSDLYILLEEEADNQSESVNNNIQSCRVPH